MNEQNIFDGIPGLDNPEELSNYLAQQSVNELGDTKIPNMLNPNQNQGQAVQPEQPAQPQPQQAQQTQPQPNQGQPETYTVGGVQYTHDQLQQIIAQANAILAQQKAQQASAQSQTKPTYSPQQAAYIKQLIDRGVPMERIQAALNANNQQNALYSRIAGIEQQLAQQAYAKEEEAFINKMQTFGDKFGLTEDDLVTFANFALSKGINVAQVSDVEAIFRALYPDQYAIRLQRINSQPSGQMFGGSSMPEAPRAAASKLEDAYVEQFLKGAMPNQYSMKK